MDGQEKEVVVMEGKKRAQPGLGDEADARTRRITSKQQLWTEALQRTEEAEEVEKRKGKRDDDGLRGEK